jgi:hypothetical protein
MKAKVFDGTFIGKVVKVKFELEFYVEDENVELTPEQVKMMIKKEDRIELGETVLNFLKKAEVITV